MLHENDYTNLAEPDFFRKILITLNTQKKIGQKGSKTDLLEFLLEICSPDF